MIIKPRSLSNRSSLCLLMATSFSSPAKKQHHVAVFAFPFGGHAATLYSFTRQLAAKAPDAIFSFFTTPTSKASLISSPCGPNLKLYDVSDGVPDGHVLAGKPLEDIDLFLKATPGNFLEALKGVVEAEERDVSCFLTDSLLWFAGRTAEEVRVPWVAFWTSGACSLSAHVYTDVLRHTFGGPTGNRDRSAKNDKHLGVLPGFSKVRVCDLPEGIVWGPMNASFFLLIHNMAKEILVRATVVVVNTFYGLEPTIIDDLQLKLHKCLPLGPLSLLFPPPPQQDPHACVAFLQRFSSSSVVYVSFGTGGTPRPAELKALAEGLEESGVPFLWSLKERAKEGLPEGFMERTKERGLVVPWAPQTMVLEHGAVGAFVTHCGWNSVLESIAAGVPMIGCPLFGDHTINGRMVSHVWEVGVLLDGGKITKEGIVWSIDLALRKEEGKSLRDKIGLLKDAAKEAVRDGGSSMKSFNELLKVIVPS